MKIAVVHDRFENKGGAERVAIEIAKALNVKTIYTTYWKPERSFEELKKFRIVQINNFINLKLNSFTKIYGFIRMFDAWKFSLIEELSEYDLIWTSGMWAVFASKNNPNNIWYCHSPNRAIYDLYPHLLNQYTGFTKLVFKTWANFWKKRDQMAVRYVKHIIANSKNTKNRIYHAYSRNAEIIYPPVDVKKFYNAKSEGYWLSVQRIMPEKRVDLQIKIFRRLPSERLIIVGQADYYGKYQEKIVEMIKKTPNVEWIGQVNEKTLIDLYAHAKGVIQTSIDEDFGLVPIEAFASGKPVLAVNEGGFRETVISQLYGKLINPPYLENFVKTIKEFDESQYDPKIIRGWAENFSVEKFRDRIKKKSSEVVIW